MLQCFVSCDKKRSLNLSISAQIDLFSEMIKPKLLYGSQIWAIGNPNIIEWVHIIFFMLTLNPGNKSYLTFGELGIYPLKARTISFGINYLILISA